MIIANESAILKSPTQLTQLEFVEWGLVSYSEQMQLDLVEKIAKQEIPETIVFCSHHPVVTLGRKSDRKKDLLGWTGDIAEVRRGGKATYHGPSQLIIYPFYDLRKAHNTFAVQDVMGLIKHLENTVVNVLAEYGLQGEPGHKKNGLVDIQNQKDKEDLLTGVWVNNKKICSLGIAVSKWISFHGIALNVTKDPQAFKGINPCGFSNELMTDMETELGKVIPKKDLQKHFEQKII
jgi:lipoyl(octanoyl) transferase